MIEPKCPKCNGETYEKVPFYSGDWISEGRRPWLKKKNYVFICLDCGKRILIKKMKGGNNGKTKRKIYSK